MNEFRYRLLIVTQSGGEHWTAERRSVSPEGARTEANRLVTLSSGVTEFVDSEGLSAFLRSRSIESVIVVPVSHLEEKP